MQSSPIEPEGCTFIAHPPTLALAARSRSEAAQRPQQKGRVCGHKMRVRDGSPKGGDALAAPCSCTIARPRAFARERPKLAQFVREWDSEQMMRKCLLLSVFLTLTSSPVLADDAESPSIGSLNAVTEGDIGDLLDYQCVTQADGLHCHFEQNIIMKTDNTCEVRHHSFDEVLTKKADGLWTQSTGPKGTCGVVDNSRFVRDSSSKNNIVKWNYMTQQTFTNETGFAAYGAGMISCKKAKESGAEQEFTYKWPVKSEYFGCLFIKH
jgi:hypothetical protein